MTRIVKVAVHVATQSHHLPRTHVKRQRAALMLKFHWTRLGYRIYAELRCQSQIDVSSVSAGRG
jgi:hypothetical protein